MDVESLYSNIPHEDGIAACQHFLQKHNRAMEPTTQLISPITYYYENLLAFFYTVNEINKNPAILPNLTLGYHIYDSCADPRKAIRSILQILSGPGHIVPNYSCTRKKKKVVGFIGDHFSLTTLPIAQLLGIYPYSQYVLMARYATFIGMLLVKFLGFSQAPISYGATDMKLSYRNLFPSFFRTVPSEGATYFPLFFFLGHFGWTWVGIISSDDDAGENETSLLTHLLFHFGICVAYVIKCTELYLKGDIRRKSEVIKKSSAQIIIGCGTFSRLMQRFFKDFGRVLQEKTLILNPTFAPHVIYNPVTFNLSFLIDLKKDNMPNMENYFKTFHPLKNPKDMILENIWIKHFHCSSGKKEKDELLAQMYGVRLHKCNGREQIENILLASSFTTTYQIYLAVRSLADALHNMYISHGHQSTDHQIHQYTHKRQYNDGQYHCRFDTDASDKCNANNDQSQYKRTKYATHFFRAKEKQLNNDLQIINLSSVTLSSEQMTLLKKGLPFTPTPDFDESNWVKDINLFARKLILHKYHLIRSRNPSVIHQRENEAIRALEALEQEHLTGPPVKVAPFSDLKPKSQYTPTIALYHNIETFVNMVSLDLAELGKRKKRQSFPSNLTKEECNALDKLRKNNDIEIKNSDKGGNIVLTNKADYLAMTLRILDDRNTYEILRRDPTVIFLWELKVLLMEGDQETLLNFVKYLNENDIGMLLTSKGPKSEEDIVPEFLKCILLVLDVENCLFSAQAPKSQCSENCSPGQRKVRTSSIHFCCYDCAKCPEGEISNISDSENCRKCPEDAWSNENRTLCVMKEMEYLSYTEDIISIAFSFLTTFFWILTLLILLIFVSQRDTAIVRANNKNLSFVLLVSIMLSFLSVFLFLGRPVDTTCRLRQISTGILLSISISSLLAKTIMVYMAFRATKPGSVWSRWSGVTLPNCVLLICSSVQGVIGMSWVTLSPPFQELDTHSYKEKMVVQCNEGSDLCFYFVLGYMGILAAVSFITAFLARTLPDSFNEAKYITFSMLVFCSVWIAMIPAYLSTKGKYMVAVEIFAILTSNAGLLGCIFFPKCYIILFKPELNTRKHILGTKNTM
ncbi:vomeronasal type-2 receptor 26-like [Dendropsophus ebraccatus]|uniref:vomeronasal type-2 receptor 26-like n=1 Tax=Dendropsophus ebraccatus TaxID=150705 RepID=UPI003831D358